MCDYCEESKKEEFTKLKDRNKYLEELCYNTRRNSGKLDLVVVENADSISAEIKEINDRDELIALRNEFKNLIQVNNDLRKKIQPQTPCCYYFCVVV